MAWTPAEYIELVKVIGALCVPVATAYSIIAAFRSKLAIAASLANAESIKAVSANVTTLEKNTNSISERNERIARALGVTEGVAREQGAQDRANAVANAAAAPPTAAAPLPVADDRVAVATERMADAAESKKPDK